MWYHYVGRSWLLCRCCCLHCVGGDGGIALGGCCRVPGRTMYMSQLRTLHLLINKWLIDNDIDS